MRIFARAVLAGLLAVSPFELQAIDAEGPIEDPQAAALYEQLTHEVRCLVCQNQTVADSNAPLAADLRREIRRMVIEGRDAEEIRGFLLERYGDFVLYKPRFSGVTVLLWLAPALLVAGGGLVLARILRRRRALPADRDADEEGEGA